MTITVRPVEPASDAGLLHAWVTQDRAAFWGMTECDVERVEEIYGYIDEQEHLAAYLVSVGDEPVALFQTYDPEVDEIGEWYDRRPGDLGVHLLLADTPARAGRTDDVIRTMITHLAESTGCTRLVLEPDARNEASLALLTRLGAVKGPLVDLRTSIAAKPAQFFFLDVG